MDPLSQGVLGATLPQALIKKTPYMKYGFLFAFLGGMAPDLDVLIKSDTDTLLALEFHRQFTHSLIFIPFGALICSIAFHYLFYKRMPFKLNYLYTLLGYATHGLLDACTTYGTQLFWPFSNTRVAWNNISIIDPLFTIPLLILVFTSLIKKQPKYGKMALLYGLLYLSFGVFQRNRAIDKGQKLAQERGHQVLSISAKASFGNLLLWKVIYETNDKYYSDAVRTGFDIKIYPGESIEKLDLKKDFPWLIKGSQHSVDIERFRWFSMGYIAKHPDRKDFIYDIRYSFLPNQMNGLWGIQLFEDNQESHVIFQPTRDLDEKTTQSFYKMLFE